MITFEVGDPSSGARGSWELVLIQKLQQKNATVPREYIESCITYHVYMAEERNYILYLCI